MKYYFIIGGIIDNNASSHKSKTKAEILREVDSFTPHLKILFSIWIPKEEERENKLLKKTSFGEFMTNQIKENDESEIDNEKSTNDGRIRTSDDDSHSSQGKSDFEKDSKIGGNTSNNEKHGSTQQTVILTDLEKYFLTQAEDLSVILAGRVCAVSSLRFSTPDVIHLAAGIAKVCVL